MSKSFDFCKATAQNTYRSSYADRSWDNAVEVYETEAIFDKYLHGARNFFFEGKVDDETEICFDVSISFDGNADFDYFTSESCVHDGTLYFIRETMDMCVRKVCLAQTHNLRTAKEWLETEYNGGFYLHDASTSTYLPYCFSGDTKIMTKNGLRRLDELNGMEISVLNKNRGWENAIVKCFGRQELRTIIIQAEGMTYSIDAVVNVVTKSMRLASIFVPGIQSGETHTMKEWVEILGIKYGTLQSRIARGWSYKKALTKK